MNAIEIQHLFPFEVLACTRRVLILFCISVCVWVFKVCRCCERLGLHKNRKCQERCRIYWNGLNKLKRDCTLETPLLLHEVYRTRNTALASIAIYSTCNRILNKFGDSENLPVAVTVPISVFSRALFCVVLSTAFCLISTVLTL